MPPELTWSNLITVLNLSGPQCGTVTRMVKTPGMMKWTTQEGNRPGLLFEGERRLIKKETDRERQESLDSTYLLLSMRELRDDY